MNKIHIDQYCACIAGTAYTVPSYKKTANVSLTIALVLLQQFF